jgi:hypothetical protein
VPLGLTKALVASRGEALRIRVYFLSTVEMRVCTIIVRAALGSLHSV